MNKNVVQQVVKCIKNAFYTNRWQQAKTERKK